MSNGGSAACSAIMALLASRSKPCCAILLGAPVSQPAGQACHFAAADSAVQRSANKEALNKHQTKASWAWRQVERLQRAYVRVCTSMLHRLRRQVHRSRWLIGHNQSNSAGLFFARLRTVPYSCACRMTDSLIQPAASYERHRIRITTARNPPSIACNKT